VALLLSQLYLEVRSPTISTVEINDCLEVRRYRLSKLMDIVLPKAYTDVLNLKHYINRVVHGEIISSSGGATWHVASRGLVKYLLKTVRQIIPHRKVTSRMVFDQSGTVQSLDQPLAGSSYALSGETWHAVSHWIGQSIFTDTAAYTTSPNICQSSGRLSVRNQSVSHHVVSQWIGQILLVKSAADTSSSKTKTNNDPQKPTNTHRRG
jgi:hypothetical protein